MKYKVSEMFESIQGEGSFSGTLVNFVRFSGCNMRCSFCDTEFNKFTLVSKERMYNQIKDYLSKIIVFTGGEPMLQLNQELVDYFVNKGYSVHIETNGSIDIFLRGIDHIVVSPKDPMKWLQKTGSDLKILIGPDDENMPLDEIVSDTTFKNYFLQPISGPRYDDALQNCIQLIMYNPTWKLSVQLHKIINVK